MKTQIAPKNLLKFFAVGRNWPAFLLVTFLLTGCPSGGDDGGGGVTAPAIPANLDAISGDQRVTVTWDSAAGAFSYNVYWSTTSGTGTGGTLEYVSASPFYHDGVTNTKPYYYVVTAVNDAGESGSSSEVTAIPDDILLSGLSFYDGNLQDCFNTWLLSNPTLTYVHELTSLTCNSSSIADITGIEALTSMTYLRIDNNSIIDISALAKLTSLSTLVLRNNSLSDVSALAGLTSLTILSLSNNSITDVSPLASLTSLENLILSNNSITDVSALASLTSLTEELYLADNSITNVSPLASLTSLKFLMLSNNTIGGQGVGNVDDLQSLTSAFIIDLANNIDMSCTELTTLIAELGSPVNPATVSEGTNCTAP